MQLLAMKHEGKIMPEQIYVNNKTALLWGCGQCGQIFKANPLDVQRGHWCPRCATLHINESKCRFIFETFTGFRFPKNRKIFNNKFELDGFNENLHCAFEYHGEYHYKHIPFLHKNRSLQELQKIDNKKKRLCKQKEINLLIIPFYAANQESMILDFLVFNKIHIVQNYIDWSYFRGNTSILNQLSVFVKSKGGKFLSKSYLGSGKLHEWECEHGHRFNLRPNDIKRHWCKICGIRLRAKKRMKDMKYLELLANKNDGETLSRKYAGSKIKHKWFCGQCKNVFEMAPNSVQQGRWCPPCKRQRSAIKRRNPSSRRSLAGKYIDS